MGGSLQEVPETLDVIFEEVFPEMPTHMLDVYLGLVLLLQQVAPRDDLGRVKASLKVLAAKLGRTPGEHDGCAWRCCVARLNAIELAEIGMTAYGLEVASGEL